MRRIGRGQGGGQNTNGDFQGLQLKEDICARDFKFLD